MHPRARILIVDDEERFRNTTGKLLGVRGFEVNTVGSGQDALESLRGTPYDVILLDVRMPGMNGIETLGEIKKINPAVEVIILTGHASVDTAVEIMRLGGYEYLLKPCSMDELVDKIDAAYERKIDRARKAQEGGPAERSQL
jgi:DNA-binding NtrC family response regulator